MPEEKPTRRQPTTRERDDWRPTKGPVPEPSATDPLRADEVPGSPSMLHKFGYAFQGIAYGVTTQINLKVHLVATVIVVIISLLLRVPPTQLAILLVLCGAVVAAELMNTAVECVVNLASPGFHPLAKAAKDCGAGSVLVLAITAVIVGLIIWGQALMALLAL